jgi:hypothetical protein
MHGVKLDSSTCKETWQPGHTWLAHDTYVRGGEGHLEHKQGLIKIWVDNAVAAKVKRNPYIYIAESQTTSK